MVPRDNNIKMKLSKLESVFTYNKKVIFLNISLQLVCLQYLRNISGNDKNIVTKYPTKGNVTRTII